MRIKIKYFFLFVLTLAMTGGMTAQGTNPGTSNLKHLWTFDDGTANDYVGRADGKLVGGASINKGALIISAQGQWMEMPGDFIDLHLYNEITLEAWYTPAKGQNPSFTMLAYFGNTQNTVGVDYYFMTAARLDIVSRAAISCGNYSTPWSAETGVNGTEYDDGNLHHMVSTLTKDTIKLFIDGALTGAKQLDTNNSISKISPAFAYLAKSGYTGDAQWIGQIHKFSIYNRALSADEVLYLAHQIPTAVDKEKTAMAPVNYSLSQNYPNPFNPSTTIKFELPVRASVTLEIYNLLGMKVRTLVHGEVMSADFHQIEWNGKNDAGVSVASGVYLYRLNAGTYQVSKKMMMLK